VSSWSPLPEELRPFPNFVVYLIREMGLSGDATLRQCEIADYQETGPNSSIICGFRGVAKSFIGGCCYSLWRLRCDPFNEKVLVTAATAEKAGEIAEMVKQAIGDVDILRCLETERGRRSSVKAFDVANARPDQVPSLRIVGVFSPAVTGKRATCIAADDIETLHNTVTQYKRDRLALAVTEFPSLLKPDDPDFRPGDPVDFEAAGIRQIFPRRLTYYGTPHLEDSLYWKLVRERNFSIRFWPARYPDPNNEDEWGCYDGHLAPGIAEMVLARPELAGLPTDPERFPEDDLLRREQGMTPIRWKLQWMLNTRLADAERYPVRLGDLMVLDLDGKALPELLVWGNSDDLRLQELSCVGIGSDRFYYRPQAVGSWTTRETRWSCVLAVDPSGRGHDELAWAVVAELNGNLFLLDAGGSSRGYEPDVLRLLATKARQWGCTDCLVEGNYGDGMFIALLQPVMNSVYPLAIEEVRVSNTKESRIVDILAPVVQTHRLAVSRQLLKAAWIEAERDAESGHARSLPYQLSRLTDQKGCLEWLDRVDALSIGVGHFTQAAMQDQRRASEQRKQEEIEAEIEDFLEDANTAVSRWAFRSAMNHSRQSRAGLQQ
jgi:hypothetical protein